MATKRQSKLRNSWKPLIPVVVVLLLAAAGAWIVWGRAHILSTTNGTRTAPYSPPQSNSSASNEQKKSAPPPSPSTDNDSPTPKFSVSLTASKSQDGSGNPVVHVGTVVDNITDGTCTLTATQGQTSVQLGSSTVSNSGTYYWCGAFNPPISRFPTAGSWTLMLTVVSKGARATASTTVTI